MSPPFLHGILPALMVAVSLMVGCDRTSAQDAPKIEDLDYQNGLVAKSIASSADILVGIDREGHLRTGATKPGEATTERLSLDDPSVRGALKLLGLEKASTFSILGVQNPRCVKTCQVIGGDMICTKVCS